MSSPSYQRLVDDGSGRPLYDRVYRVIAGAIERGELAPGDRIPAERALCEQLGVSRVTVRRAFRRLAEDGLIVSGVGRGSFVSPAAPVGEPPNELMSFSEMARAQGFTPTSRLLSAEIRPATIEEAEAFGIVPGADVFDLRRLRFLDGVAIALDVSRVPLSLAPELATTDFTQASLYRTLDAAGVSPTAAEYVIGAVPTTAEDAALLELAEGAPVLEVSTRTYDARDRLIELCTIRYRGDRYRYRSQLTRRRAGLRLAGAG
jgi:GntR family transcriptional regulator